MEEFKTLSDMTDDEIAELQINLQKERISREDKKRNNKVYKSLRKKYTELDKQYEEKKLSVTLNIPVTIEIILYYDSLDKEYCWNGANAKLDGTIDGLSPKSNKAIKNYINCLDICEGEAFNIFDKQIKEVEKEAAAEYKKLSNEIENTGYTVDDFI